jgi:hypothetical protein
MRRLIALMPLLALLLTSCSGFVEEVRNEVESELEAFETYDDYDYEYDDYEDMVFLSDFEDACSGVAMDKGTALSESGIHPVALFDRDSEFESYYNTSYILPESWEASYETPEETELVVCLTTVPGDFVEACPYDIEGVEYNLSNYTASYEAELYVATTGELLASTMLELPAEECPMYWYFYDLEEDYYPGYDQVLTDWIKPYAQN